MHKSAVTPFLWYLVLLVVNANTTTRNRAAQATIDACRNLTSTTSPSETGCWDALHMDIWMSNWNATTTQCLNQESWATCFMRLTFEENPTADYICTNVSMPQNCTEPLPGHIAQGPAEIYYGAYSIWNLVQYLGNWNTALTSASANMAITNALLDPDSAVSATTLLAALMSQYGVNNTLSSAVNALITVNGEDFGNQVRPTSMNAQLLLGELLQSTLDFVTSDWKSGSFASLAANGMLLNNTGETSEFLTSRLSLQ